MLRNMLEIGGSSEGGSFAAYVDFRVALAREAAGAVPARTRPLRAPASPSRGALRYRSAAPPADTSGQRPRGCGETSGQRTEGLTSSQLHVCPVCFIVQIILNEELGVRSSVNSLQSKSRV